MWKNVSAALLALALMGAAAHAAGPSDPQVMKLQQALKKYGADIKPDGRMGDGTRTAILNFQSSQGLPTTGEPDQATLQKLGLAKGGTVAKPAAPTPATAKPAKPETKVIETQKGAVNATKIISPGRVPAK